MQGVDVCGQDFLGLAICVHNYVYMLGGAWWDVDISHCCSSVERIFSEKKRSSFEIPRVYINIDIQYEYINIAIYIQY